MNVVGDALPIQKLLEGGWWSGAAQFVWRCLLAEALDIDRDRGEDMLDVGFVATPVPAPAHTVAVNELEDGGLDPGPHGVALPPGRLLTCVCARACRSNSSCGRKPTIRFAPFVHCSRTGHGPHWPLANFTTMTGAGVGQGHRTG